MKHNRISIKTVTSKNFALLKEEEADDEFTQFERLAALTCARIQPLAYLRGEG